MRLLLAAFALSALSLTASSPALADVPNDECGTKEGAKCRTYDQEGTCRKDSTGQVFCDTSQPPKAAADGGCSMEARPGRGVAAGSLAVALLAAAGCVALFRGRRANEREPKA